MVCVCVVAVKVGCEKVEKRMYVRPKRNESGRKRGYDPIRRIICSSFLPLLGGRRAPDLLISLANVMRPAVTRSTIGYLFNWYGKSIRSARAETAAEKCRTIVLRQLRVHPVWAKCHRSHEAGVLYCLYCLHLRIILCLLQQIECCLHVLRTGWLRLSPAPARLDKGSCPCWLPVLFHPYPILSPTVLSPIGHNGWEESDVSACLPVRCTARSVAAVNGTPPLHCPVTFSSRCRRPPLVLAAIGR